MLGRQLCGTNISRCNACFNYLLYVVNSSLLFRGGAAVGSRVVTGAVLLNSVTGCSEKLKVYANKQRMTRVN